MTESTGAPRVSSSRRRLAHLLQKGSPLQRIGIDDGPQQRPQLRRGAPGCFLMSKKIGCGIGRNYSGHWRDGG